MSSSISLLQTLFDKFWRALNLYEKRDLSSRYEKIYPGYRNIGIEIVGDAPQFNHLGYIPLISVTQLLHTSYEWKEFFDISNMNNYLNNRKSDLRLAQNISLTVPVDKIIGEAIHERLSHRIQNPKPYQHQADAIVFALAILDVYRQELRRGKWPSADRIYDALAILADTASGKTEIFESIALQLILDSKNLKNYSNDNVKVIIIYPMKSLMIDHLRRLIRDIYYINQRSGRVITLGVLTGDTPTLPNLTLTQKGKPHKEAEEWLNSITTCPFDHTPLKVRLSEVSEFNNTIYFSEIECSNPTTPHRFNFLRIHREIIYQNPPDILVTTPDFLNRVLYFYRGNVLPRLFKHGPPLLIILDEPHMYTGTFGANVSLLLREFENVMQIKFGLKNYRPFYILTSATMPNAKEFLARLLVMNPDRIYELSNFSPQSYLHNIGIVALLPTSDYGIRNAAVEVPLVVASILERNSRKVLVFIDSVERAEQLRYQIEDYKNRRFPQEYQVCQNNTIYAPDICPNGKYNPGFVEVRVIHARMDPKSRSGIEAELRKPDKPLILITTPALEIGIDVEDVSAVILVGIPPTPTSFRQRIGRTGRRANRPGMVIIIGDETRGVDQYYLIDQERLIQYLRLAREYYLPLQPANPLYIRARLGNYLGGYAQISKNTDLKKAHNFILNNYEELSINSVINTFSETQYETLKNISKMTSILSNKLKNDLRSIIDCLKKNNYENIIKIDMRNVRVLRGIIRNCLKMYVPFIIRDLRTPAFTIKLRFPKILGIKDIEEDIKVALVTHSIANITQYKEHDNNIDMSECYKTISRAIRGTLHPRSVNFGGKNIQLLFEVCGVKGRILSENVDIYIKRCRDNLEFIAKNLDGNIDQTLQNVPNVFLRRLSKIIEIIDEWIMHVNYNKQGSPTLLASYLPFVIPEILYLDLVMPNYIYIKDKTTGFAAYYYVKSYKDLFRILYKDFNIKNYKTVLKKDIEIINLPYLEWSDRGFANKLQDITKGKSIDNIFYNDKDYDLVFNISGNEISYKRSTGKLCEIRSDIRTFPRTFTCINLDKSTILLGPKTDGLGIFEITYLDDVEVWIMNQGFLVRKPDRGVMPHVGHSYFKRIGTRRRNWFLGYNYITKAVKISINWTNIVSRLNKLTETIPSIYYTYLGYVPQNYLEDFKIRISHTLSHIIINFHSVFTGAHAWDVSEYINFDSKEGIVKSHIIIFDFDEGGNGVSEIIYYKFGNILTEALKTIEKRRGRKVSPPFNFIGEPGDVLFGRWPICPYGNQGLSRELLYSFFVLLTNGNISAVSKWFP